MKLHVQREKNMTPTLKFIYAMILFLFLFFIAKEVDGKPFLILLKLYCLFYSFYTLFHFHVSNITSFSFFFAALIGCKTVDDCPKIPHLFPAIYRCINNECIFYDRVHKCHIGKTI